MRVSATDRCDLRCGYCIPNGHAGFCERPDVLRADEFARLISLFAELGVSRVRLTGGEPLTRADLPKIAERIGAIAGIDDASLSTNATQLASQAIALHAAGVRRLNVSLDSLGRQRFAAIVGRDCLDDVLRGLEAASAAGFS
ncbi:MAG TPA: radical SAM protein, partial [Rhodocyclaceae bacterium]